MPSRYRLALVGVVLQVALSNAWAQAPAHCAHLRDGDGLQLAGRVGTTEVRAFLDTGYPAEGEDGMFAVWFASQATVFDDGTVIGLEGTIDADCRATLEELNGTAIWHLRIADRVTGTTERPGRPPGAIDLHVVPAPDCSGAGPWRTFRSAKWPVTFDYPTSWRFSQQGDTITLECPDPARLAFGGRPIVISLAVDESDVTAEDGQKGHWTGSFVTFAPGEWLVGDDACERPAADRAQSAYCRRARQARRNGMLVLQGEAGEDRGSFPGGSSTGQGPGVMHYLFVLDRREVSLDSRDGPARSRSPEATTAIDFAGDDVTSRMVRSVKRR